MRECENVNMFKAVCHHNKVIQKKTCKITCKIINQLKCVYIYNSMSFIVVTHCLERVPSFVTVFLNPSLYTIFVMAKNRHCNDRGKSSLRFYIVCLLASSQYLWLQPLSTLDELCCPISCLGQSVHQFGGYP